MAKNKARKKTAIITVLLILIGLVAVWWAISVLAYNAYLNQRFESDPAMLLYVEDFDGLERTGYEFASDKGQMLKGYMYSACEDPHGIIILAHGFGGGGHNSYMMAINYFAQNGFLVFAYDATGNDESEGDGVGGFPQGVIDLDYAITFVEESGNFPDLPIGLFGHSWGGYSVCNVLSFHPEIKGVIECAGSVSSADLFTSGGLGEVGPLIYPMSPFIKLHERIKYGQYAVNTGIDGFETSGARGIIVHSANDDIVRIGFGYDKYYERFKDDPKFTFIRFEDRGHNGMLLDPDNTYAKEFNAGFMEWAHSLGYDINAKANRDRFAKDKAEYVRAHLDREKYADRIDKELFDQFIEFYDECFAS